MKVIIVGGVAGGATAAARLRRLDENAEIIMIERDEYVSYANCGLPYYVGGVIKEKNNLLVQSVKGLSARYKLDIRIKSEVVNVDKAAKTVTVRRKDDGTEYVESYDKLLQTRHSPHRRTQRRRKRFHRAQRFRRIKDQRLRYKKQSKKRSRSRGRIHRSGNGGKSHRSGR